MNTDGTQVRQLTDNDDVWDASPAWSPDSKRIAFMRVDLYEKVEIFVMNADGTEVRQITDNDYVDVYPAWSPDGKRIAFDSDRDGDFEVFVMNPDGTEVRQLTDNDHADGHSVWSPDGSQIAFASDRDTPKIHDGFGTFEIFVMNADGTDVYSTGQEGYSPSWGG